MVIPTACFKTSMDKSENSPDDEEEILVYAEFEDNVKFDKYSGIHVLGIDTKHPIFQLDDTFFTGTYENPLGTYMFFEEDPSPSCSDPLFDKVPEKNLKYLCKTRKFMTVEHAYITPKEERQELDLQSEEHAAINDEIQPADFKSIQDALEIFKKDWEQHGASE